MGINFPTGAGDPPAPLVVVLSNQLPSKGKLGVYVRMRGVASLALVVARDKEQFLTEKIDLGNTATFVERTFDVAREWTDANGAPDKIVLLAQPGNTLAEVDCIIPYVTP